MSTESQPPEPPGEPAAPEAQQPASSSADDTLTPGKSGEGAHSALAMLKRLQARSRLHQPPELPDAEPETP